MFCKKKTKELRIALDHQKDLNNQLLEKLNDVEKALEEANSTLDECRVVVGGINPKVNLNALKELRRILATE